MVLPRHLCLISRHLELWGRTTEGTQRRGEGGSHYRNGAVGVSDLACASAAFDGWRFAPWIHLALSLSLVEAGALRAGSLPHSIESLLSTAYPMVGDALLLLEHGKPIACTLLSSKERGKR